MTDMKEEKKMPLELAIQRELAYRRTMAALTLSLQPTETSTEKLLPLQTFQVISPCQAAGPLPLPSPTSNPIPTPCISGTKRKEPFNSANHHLPLKNPEPFHGSFTSKARIDNLYCKICQLSCLSPSNLAQHLRGQKHKARVQELKFSHKNGREGKSNQRQWCELCKVPCMNEDLLRMHFQGQKHKAALQKLEIIKKGGEIPNQRKWCELCSIWCIDEFAFKQHIQGKKHSRKLHALQKEKD